METIIILLAYGALATYENYADIKYFTMGTTSHSAIIILDFGKCLILCYTAPNTDREAVS